MAIYKFSTAFNTHNVNLPDGVYWIEDPNEYYYAEAIGIQTELLAPVDEWILLGYRIERQLYEKEMRSRKNAVVIYSDSDSD